MDLGFLYKHNVWQRKVRMGIVVVVVVVVVVVALLLPLFLSSPFLLISFSDSLLIFSKKK